MSRERARKLMERLRREGEQAGYLLAPDEELVLDLMDGLLVNEDRYGYWACPCREAEGVRAEDLDIICPCDYRDDDLDEFGACYCGLYVSEEVAKGERPLEPIPERRPLPEERGKQKKEEEQRREEDNEKSGHPWAEASLPVWRCTVCGYLCARPQPPLKCPVCKADKDRFELFS